MSERTKQLRRDVADGLIMRLGYHEPTASIIRDTIINRGDKSSGWFKVDGASIALCIAEPVIEELDAEVARLTQAVTVQNETIAKLEADYSKLAAAKNRELEQASDLLEKSRAEVERHGTTVAELCAVLPDDLYVSLGSTEATLATVGSGVVRGYCKPIDDAVAMVREYMASIAPKEPTPEDVIVAARSRMKELLGSEGVTFDEPPVSAAFDLAESLLAEKREREKEPEWPKYPQWWEDKTTNCPGVTYFCFTSPGHQTGYNHRGQSLGDDSWGDEYSIEHLRTSSVWRRIPEPAWAKAGREAE